MRSVSPWLWPTLKRAVVCFMAAMSIYFIPAELQDELDEFNYGLFGRFYGEGSLFNKITRLELKESAESISKDIAVVVIDDETLKRWNTSWPVSWEFHAELLSHLVDSGAKHVVFDFVFLDKRGQGETEKFRVAVENAVRNGVSVVFASSHTSPAGPEESHKSHVSEHAILASANYEGGVRSPYRYQLRDNVTGMKSIAYEVYDQVCRKENSSRYPGCASRAGIQEDLPVWINWPGNKKQEGVIDTCTSYPVQAGKNGDDGIVSRGVYLFFDGILADYNEVYPFKSLRAECVLGVHEMPCHVDDEGKQKIECPEKMYLRYVHDMAGKVVFVGGELQGYQDFVYPASFEGSVPGVFVHAMALENLLDRGSGYATPDRSEDPRILPFFLKSVDHLEFCLFLLAMAVSLIVSMKSSQILGKLNKFQKVTVLIVFDAACFFAVVMIPFLGFNYLMLASTNWVSIVSLFASVTFISMVSSLDEFAGRLSKSAKQE